MKTSKPLLIILGLASTTFGKSCCQNLDFSLPGKVHYPSTSTYTAFNSRRWSNTTILAPSCVILPESTNDVSLAVKTLVAGADGNATACQFAIKSGGHNPNPGANNMNGGIVLDLGHLNDTSISADRRTVRLGAGATWLHAYDTVPGVLFPGGACSGTGVGGVSLGGGMSVFLAEVGWVVNSVRNFELVLASGEVINANSTHHTALYKAMKGGGSNFGVLTHVDVEVMREGGLVYGGQVTHLATPDVTNQLLTNLTRYVKANNKDPKAGFQVAFLASDGVILADSLLVYSDPVAGAPILQPFLDIQPSLTNTMGMRNMSDITREVNALQPNGYRELAGTYTFDNDDKTVFAVQKVTMDVYDTIKDIPGMEYIWTYIPMPYAIIEQSERRGGDMLGLARRKKDRITYLFTPRWLDQKYDDRMYEAAQKWVAGVDKATKALGTSDEFLYMNFAGHFQDPLSTYGKENVDFMTSTARNYDPAGVFHNLVPGGFKLKR